MNENRVFRNGTGFRGIRQHVAEVAARFPGPLSGALVQVALGLGLATGWSAACASDGPSFDCGGVKSGSIEALVCENAGLSALDRELADVYAAASAKAHNEQPPVLKGEQRGWIKGRDECWKAEDARACVEEQYRLRIAELQARYALVDAKGPVFYACDGNPANEVVVTFYATDPPTLIAERGDQTSFMVRSPAASGAKYTGRNESFWEHQGEAMVTWGFEAPVMRCEPRDSSAR